MKPKRVKTDKEPKTWSIIFREKYASNDDIFLLSQKKELKSSQNLSSLHQSAQGQQPNWSLRWPEKTETHIIRYTHDTQQHKIN